MPADNPGLLDLTGWDWSPLGAGVPHWRPKAEPFLWLADGVCGAVRGFLLGGPDQDHYDRLCQAGVIGDLIYINDDPGLRHA